MGDSGCGSARDGESAKFWLAVLTEINNRGAGDVYIVVCDGLKGCLTRSGRPGRWPNWTCGVDPSPAAQEQLQASVGELEPTWTSSGYGAERVSRIRRIQTTRTVHRRSV